MDFAATTSFLAARDPDWIQVVIVVGIVVLSMLGSAAKWIAQQFSEARERAAQQRGRRMFEINQPAAHDEDELPRGIPPFAAPPPVVGRTSRRRAETENMPPVIEKVFEVLLEKTAGTPLEGRMRELMPRRPVPPPKRKLETATRKPTRPPAPPKKPMTIAEREQRFPEQTDQRTGHVQTHIASLDSPEAEHDEFRESLVLDDPDAVRRALILSEIRAPPVAMR
jgi:hypothetical protein